MHYGERAFVKFPNLTTIRPKKAGVSIGQQGYLTELDVKQMNLYYNCTDHLLLTNLPNFPTKENLESKMVFQALVYIMCTG